jgi:hypothetical protein
MNLTQLHGIITSLARVYTMHSILYYLYRNIYVSSLIITASRYFSKCCQLYITIYCLFTFFKCQYNKQRK